MLVLVGVGVGVLLCSCVLLGVANILCCSSRWFAISIATLLIDMASMQKERKKPARECE